MGIRLDALRNSFFTRDIAPAVEQELDAALKNVVAGDGVQGIQGETGPAGQSAYQVAVANGFVGSEATWLASLVGPPGQDGAAGVGIQGPKGDAGEAGPQGNPGSDGAAGADGADGVGVPAGGTQGQVLRKASNTDHDTEWATVSGDGGGCPFPVDGVYISYSSANPSTYWAGTTWIACGAGRMFVGFNGADGDFDEAGTTGGAKTHTLTDQEMPSHTHTQDAHGHTVTDPGHTHAQQRFPTATGGSTGFTVDTSMSGTPAAANATASATTGLTVNNATAVNQSTGGGAAHNNMPPYEVVYKFRRTA